MDGLKKAIKDLSYQEVFDLLRTVAVHFCMEKENLSDENTGKVIFWYRLSKMLEKEFSNRLEREE